MNRKKEVIKYAGRSIGILLLATGFSIVLAEAGIGKENVLMIYIVGVLLVTACTR